MAYGFYVKNASGETVIDDTYPSLLLSSESTLTGVMVNKWGLGNVYEYALNTLGIDFVKLAVGDWILHDPTSTATRRLVSNKSTLATRKGVSARNIATPTGYGMVVKDSASRITFAASQDIIPISDFYTHTVDGVLTNTVATNPQNYPVTCSNEWVSLATFSRGYHSLGGGFTSFYTGGIKRYSTTVYHPYLAVFAAIPQDVMDNKNYGNISFVGGLS